MLEIDNLQELQNELENVIKITHLMQKITPKTTRLNIDIERSFKNGIHDIANYKSLSN